MQDLPCARRPADDDAVDALCLAQAKLQAPVELSLEPPTAPDLANGLVVAVTETTTAEDIDALAKALEEELA